MGAFAKIAAGKIGGGGSRIRDGIYKLVVEKVFVNNGFNGETFITEFRVLDSKSSGELDEKGNPIIPNAVGSTCSVAIPLSDPKIPGDNISMTLLYGITAGIGYNPEDLTEEKVSLICSTKNPLRGVMVGDETYRGVNQGKKTPANAGKPMTLHRWQSVPQTEEQILANRVWLDEQVKGPSPVTGSGTVTDSQSKILKFLGDK